MDLNDHNNVPFPTDADAPRPTKQKKTPVASASGGNGARRSRFTPKRADTVIATDHEFLWKPYIPLHEYTVLTADGGTGKSYLSAYIAAIVSTGRNFPTEPNYVNRKAGNVLFVNSEDDSGDIRNRLEKCGADLSRINILDKEAVFDPASKTIISYTDPDMEWLFQEYKPDVVIFDPIHAFLPRGVEMNKLQDMRRITTLIANMAKAHDCAILLLSHQGKSAKGANAAHATLGSVDITNASRSCLQLVFDDENVDARFLVHTKSNHAALGDGMRFVFGENGTFHFDRMRPDVTKATIEEAINRKEKLSTVLNRTRRRNDFDEQAAEKARTILSRIDADSKKTEFNIAYKCISDEFGKSFWCGMQPKACLNRMEPTFKAYGYSLSFKSVKYHNVSEPGFMLSKGYSYINVPCTSEASLDEEE